MTFVGDEIGGCVRNMFSEVFTPGGCGLRIRQPMPNLDGWCDCCQIKTPRPFIQGMFLQNSVNTLMQCFLHFGGDEGGGFGLGLEQTAVCFRHPAPLSEELIPRFAHLISRLLGQAAM